MLYGYPISDLAHTGFGLLAEFGVFVDSYGRRSRTDDLKWSRLPLAFGESHGDQLPLFGGCGCCHLPSVDWALPGPNPRIQVLPRPGRRCRQPSF